MLQHYNSWGYYTYAGRQYFDQFDVYDAAIAARDDKPAITFSWPFHDEVDSRIEPEQTLGQLYKMRAHQIRDEYDYIILMYSGGTDSTQILQTFLDANIFIDEVITTYPFGFIEKLPAFVPPEHPLAYLYEFRFACTKGLQQLHSRSPNTKITLWDSTSAYTSKRMDEWTNCKIGGRISGGVHGLFHGLKRSFEKVAFERHMDQLHGVSVGVIYGIEKPLLRIEDNELFLYFTDLGRMINKFLLDFGDQIAFDPIMFFWGNRLIPIKQGHLIKRVLNNNPLTVEYIRNEMEGFIQVDKGIPGIDIKLIYPDWPGWYQTANKRSEAGILDFFSGRQALDAATVRTEFFNRRFGKLTGSTMKMHTKKRSAFKGFLSRQHSLGAISCA